MVALEKLTAALARQHAWFDSMRQPGGYGGPVVHWWQHRLRYTGRGLDWRYEGLLIGYRRLLANGDDPRWRDRLERAANDLRDGQLPSGHFRASRFEDNPGTMGTPHEAAASLGLLIAFEVLTDPGLVEVAQRNLDALIAALGGGGGFQDVPGHVGRVPNKLATFAQALMRLATTIDDNRYLGHAETALADVLKLQERSGRWQGAIHQYAPDDKRGDGRLFPYYNARCVPPLIEAARRFDDERYLEAARGVIAFLKRTMTPEGAWPQIVYARSGAMGWPHWIAGAGDILLAFLAAEEPLPELALQRLLAGQLASGGFVSGNGFAAQRSQRPSAGLPDFRDLLPVSGWNDKTFRLLCELLPAGTFLPEIEPEPVEREVSIGGHRGRFLETGDEFRLEAEGTVQYQWFKQQPWAAVVAPAVDIR